ncbi:MAG: DUF5606 domain-containing protein [Bacteroidales bacterium]|nr:DUF5606 domain-containing protein [Bacteroidales bacterium]
MDLSKILAISGKPGLYRMLTETKNGFIVESLVDDSRFPVFTHERVSSLQEISVFTTGDDDLPLKDVLRKMHEKTEGKPGPDPKADTEKLKEFFKVAIPEYDPERVYVSDMKKAVSWYNLLLEKQILDFSEEEKEVATEGADPGEEQPEAPEEPAEEKS